MTRLPLSPDPRTRLPHTYCMNAATPIPLSLSICPSCGRPLQEFLLPSLTAPGEFVRVWGCEFCGETMAEPAPPADGGEG